MGAGFARNLVGITSERGLAFLVTATLSAAPLSAGLAAAPQQLYNKAIQINWTAQVTEHDADGKTVTPQLGASRTIYVSSAGRLFVRASRTNAKSGQSRGSDLAPGATQNSAGEARGLRFEGNKLIGAVAFAQGAGRMIATFDPSYSSCTVDLTYGREAGGMRRQGVNGVMYTIDSISVTGQSCSIREGNPFASQ
jgi:hypothetical protein